MVTTGQPVASSVLLQCQLQRWKRAQLDTELGAVLCGADACSGQEGLPGLGFPSGHALPQPLGVRGQVVDQLPADLIRGLYGVCILCNGADGVMKHFLQQICQMNTIKRVG